jgi:hypothetical protein
MSLNSTHMAIMVNCPECAIACQAWSLEPGAAERFPIDYVDYAVPLGPKPVGSTQV